MAGIGFELKRIFKKDSLFSIISGATYSTVVVIGPTILVMATILATYVFLGVSNISYAQRELLSAIILYIFIFSQIITAPINCIQSRFIADCIFEERFEDILPSFYMGLLLSEIIGFLTGLPFAIRMAVVGKVNLGFVFFGYVFFLILIYVFYALTYLTATKDYKIVAMDFFVGMVLTFVSSMGLHFVFRVEETYAILIGIMLGFFLIGVLFVSYIKHYFVVSNDSYTKCLSYYKKQTSLMFGTLFYTMGIFVHNFVFWCTSDHLVIVDCFYTYQSYDMAACLGMFTNISAMVIFTVMAETKFHDIYQEYNEAVIGETLQRIHDAKKKMFRLLMQQISYVVRVQAIISVIIFICAVTFLPDVGFSGLEMTVYPALAAAYYCVFIMYCNIIFLCYFNDNKGIFLTGFLFFACTVAATIYSCHLTPEFFGIGLLLGALVGWSYSFFRIRYLEQNFDYYIMCNMHILYSKREERPSSLIYKNGAFINGYTKK